MKINFEEAILKLENEVKKLENGNLTLDESISAFEEAVKLVRLCNEKLENAERRVRLLTENADVCACDKHRYCIFVECLGIEAVELLLHRSVLGCAHSERETHIIERVKG